MINFLNMFNNWGSIRSEHGEISFQIEGECATICGIDVKERRKGFGSELIKKLESLCLMKDINEMFVPSTPSKLAISFWIKNGFSCVFPEDSQLVNRIILKKKAENIIDTGAGIIILRKELG